MNRAVLAAAAAALISSTPVFAQTSGLVSIELTEVSSNMAERLKVDEAKIPMSIMVPPEVAAEACGVSPGAPSPQVARRGDGCMARKSTPFLDKLITSRMEADDPSAMGGPPAKGPDAASPR
ncbi:hypothetical protein [Ramlibacter sp. Leaf400]|uniref:hypothetical protein n=1 Tax=Ramlibacter sp. Leaf400 TaxID=1736365 RepID=UPI0012E3424D|nr:hypothetical protein [Ramlibacter sp. Leaf400]